MKTKGHIFILLAVIVLGVCLVSPVSAARYTLTDIPLYNRTSVAFEDVYSFEYNARDHNLAIALAQFSQPSNSKIDFTIYYGNYSSVAGSMENIETGLLDRWTNTTVTLGGESKSYTYGDVQTTHVTFSGYARDSEWWDVLNASAPGGFLLYDSGYGNFFGNDAAVFYEVADVGANTIYRITASSTEPFSCWITSGSPEDVSAGASVSPLGAAAQWVQFALSIAGALLGFVVAIFVWIKFLFIDNLLLVVALYLAVSMAYSAASSRNIFQFYKKFFRFQRSMFDFMVQMWNYLIQIVASFRGIFRI